MKKWAPGVPVGLRMAAMTGAALLALLVLVGFLVHRQFRGALRGEIDRHLADVALSEVGALRGEDAEEFPRLLLGRLDRPEGGIDNSRLEAQLLSGDGSLLAATEGLSGTDGLVREGGLVRVASGVPVYGDATIDGTSYRFIGASVDDQSERIVVVAAPIQAVTEAERALLALYGPTAVIGVILAAVAGWWIARKSLTPLRHMAAEAEAIGALDLSQRLPAPPTADDIGRLGVTLNHMLDRLDAALQRERQLTAEVSHELRTPIAIIRAELELLRAHLTDEALKGGVESALEEVDRITGAIEDILLLARAEAGARVDRPEPVDLGKLAQVVAGRFSSLASARGVGLETAGTAEIDGDERGIERAVSNLIDNSLRHIPQGGTVEIVVQQQGTGALLTVRDSGPGVPVEELGTMFDLYTRSGPRRGAAGLGLSIVAAVAASHGGNVQARNRPEGGLEVTVELR